MERKRSFADNALEVSKYPNYFAIPIGGTAYLLGAPWGAPLVIFAGLGIVATNAAQEKIRR